MENNKKSKKRIFIIVGIILIFLIFIIGVTYAYFSKKDITKREVIASSLLMEYNEDKEINLNNLYPISKNDILSKAYNLSFSLSNLGKQSMMSNIYLDINQISEELKSDCVKYRLVDINSDNYEFPIAEGDFTLASNNQKMLLKDEIFFGLDTTKNFKLYIYIEEDGTNQNYVMNKTISVELKVESKAVTYTSMIAYTSGSYFWNNNYGDNITSIEFVNHINLDNAVTLSNAKKSGGNYWDLSTANNNSIIGWLELDSENSTSESNKYHMYIGTTKNYIFANSNCSDLFSVMANLQSIKFGKVFRTDKVTNMTQMFRLNSKLKQIDLDYFDTSKVTSMRGMFLSTSLSKINLTGFNTVNVSYMDDLFRNTPYLTSLDLHKFNTKKVTNMSRMFNWCGALNLDLSSFDTSHVTNMEEMFRGIRCTTLNLENFNTSNVKNMSLMFCGTNLKSLDLSSFDTSNVTNMSLMFLQSRSLSKVNITSFNTKNVTNMESMFNQCVSLQELDLSSFDIPNSTSVINMLNSCASLKTIYVKNQETVTYLNTNATVPSKSQFVIK